MNTYKVTIHHEPDDSGQARRIWMEDATSPARAVAKAMQNSIRCGVTAVITVEVEAT